MKLYVRMVAILTSVGLISGAFLACVGILTKERIILNKQQEIEAAILRVVPGTIVIQKLYEEKSLSVYGGKNKEGKLLGYAILGSGVGFQDKISFMLGTNTSITQINSLVILEQKETPGLGAKIADKQSFLRYWENKNCSGLLRLRRPPVRSPGELASSEINTITGATVSSSAVLNMVNSALARLRYLIKDGRLNNE